MFSERFTALTFGNHVLYIIADAQRIVYIGPKEPSPMRLLRSDGHPLLEQAVAQLQSYLSGRCQTLSFAVEPSPFPFAQAVYAAAARIPYGHCVNAQKIARSLGRPQSEQAINVLCRSNPLSIRIPTHRIVPSDGRTCALDDALRQMERRFIAP